METLKDINICKFLCKDAFNCIISWLYFHPEKLPPPPEGMNINQWSPFDSLKEYFTLGAYQCGSTVVYTKKHTIKETNEKTLTPISLSTVHFVSQCNGMSVDFHLFTQ